MGNDSSEHGTQREEKEEDIQQEVETDDQRSDDIIGLFVDTLDKGNTNEKKNSRS